MRFLPALLGIALLGGCTHYEYDLLEPPDLACHVGRQETTFDIDPIRYHLRTVENRLVMAIENPTDDPITLVGRESYVVDPTGQSHPLAGQTIPPHTFTRRVFPPPRLVASGWTYTYGPYWDYGWYGHPYGWWGPGWGWGGGPVYYETYATGPGFWEWPNQTTIRLRLVYEQMERPAATAPATRPSFTRFHHDFVVGRKKM